MCLPVHFCNGKTFLFSRGSIFLNSIPFLFALSFYPIVLSLRYFVLFLFYAVLGCYMYFYAGAELVLSLFNSKPTINYSDVSFSTFFCGVITCAFGVVLTCFLGFHLNLVCTGQTTLEVHVRVRKSHRRTRRENWEAVFGKNPWLWLLPVNTLTQTVC